MAWKNLVESILDRSERIFGGDPWIYSPKTGSPYEIKGILSKEFLEQQIGSGAPIATQMPMLGSKVSNFLSLPSRGETIVRGTESYLIEFVQQDGEGGITLVLKQNV